MSREEQFMNFPKPHLVNLICDMTDMNDDLEKKLALSKEINRGLANHNAELTEKLEEANALIEKCDIKRQYSLERKLALAVEALEFYADTNNWNSEHGVCDTYIDGVIAYSDIWHPWAEQGISVGGFRAKQVLEKLK